MKKAEKIFASTRFACVRHIESRGYQVNPDGSAVGFNFVHNDGLGAVCARTLNDMDKLLKSRRSQSRISLKLGVINNDEYEAESHVLNMVESTIVNSRKALADFFA